MTHDGRMKRGKENFDKKILLDNADTKYYLDNSGNKKVNPKKIKKEVKE